MKRKQKTAARRVDEKPHGTAPVIFAFEVERWMIGEEGWAIAATEGGFYHMVLRLGGEDPHDVGVFSTLDDAKTALRLIAIAGVLYSRAAK